MNKLFYPRPLQPGDTVALVLPMLPKAIRWSPAASLAEICLS